MTSPSPRLAAAFAAIDAANAADPRRESDGSAEHPAEVLYAERMTETLGRIYPQASEVLQVAARAQHIERWTIPRDGYPEGRAGYNAWRTACRQMHAARASEIMAQHGFGPDEIAEAARIIRKEQLKRDPQSQALENVVGVVFVAHYLDPFLTKYAALDMDKKQEILVKTFRKMSPDGHSAILQLGLDPSRRALLEGAIAKAAGQ